MGVELTIVCFFSALLVLIPLPLHWKTGNICVISAIFWLAACNIVYGINAFIWRDNVDVRFKLWCDIATKIIVGGNIGIPASTLCVARHLAHASSPHCRAPSLNNKRWCSRVEAGMCVVLPVVFAALDITIEANRFGIEEGIGCEPWHYLSTPMLFLTCFPPVLVSLATSVYSGVALRWLIQRRDQSRRTSPQVGSPVPSGRYLRLVAYAVAIMTLATALSLFGMLQAVQIKVDSWTSWPSWAEVHEDWPIIPAYPRHSRSEFYWAVKKLTALFPPITSLVFFGYFGFDDRLVAEYKNILAWIKTHVLHVKTNQDPVLPLSICNATMAHSSVVRTNVTVAAPEMEPVTSGVNQSVVVQASHSLITTALERPDSELDCTQTAADGTR